MTEIDSYIERDIQYLKKLDSIEIENIIKIVNNAIIQKKRIYIAGNGGSATTASHFAEDMNGTKKVKAISLCNDISFITATANDFDYDYIFKRQLECLYDEGDLLILISASGNSKNLINAVDFVNTKGGITIGLLGFDGGALKNKCRTSLIVKTPVGMYGEVEDVHLICTHIITEYIKMINKI